MYFIELITKILTKKKSQVDYSPENEAEYEKCNHVFLPIDSSGDYLACNNCGFVIENNKKKNKNRNIFNI